MAPLFTRIATDRDVRTVVVTGSGNKAFCVGADFAGMDEKLETGHGDGNPGLMIGSAQLVQAQLHVPQPMIAAINGDALGLGATLAGWLFAGTPGGGRAGPLSCGATGPPASRRQLEHPDTAEGMTMNATAAAVGFSSLVSSFFIGFAAAFSARVTR